MFFYIYNIIFVYLYKIKISKNSLIYILSNICCEAIRFDIQNKFYLQNIFYTLKNQRITKNPSINIFKDLRFKSQISITRKNIVISQDWTHNLDHLHRQRTRKFDARSIPRSFRDKLKRIGEKWSWRWWQTRTVHAGQHTRDAYANAFETISTRHKRQGSGQKSHAKSFQFTHGGLASWRNTLWPSQRVFLELRIWPVSRAVDIHTCIVSHKRACTLLYKEIHLTRKSWFYICIYIYI